LVDDAREWRARLSQSIEAELDGLGLQSNIRRAATKQEALTALGKPNSYDLLVTDVCLDEHLYVKDTSGIELVEAARQLGIPSIAVSASVMPADVAAYYDRFGTDFFSFVDKSDFRTGLHNVLPQFCR
jgi:CheY-like chemotaxis protein